MFWCYPCDFGQSLVCGSVSSGSRQSAVTSSGISGEISLLWQIGFYLFLLTFSGELGTSCYLIKKFLINLDARFPCDNLGLASLSYVSMFQNSRIPWLTLRYKGQEYYISYQDTLANLGNQIKNISFDNSLKTMWHGRDAKSHCCFYLLIRSQVATITTLECVLIHSITFFLRSTEVRLGFEVMQLLTLMQS